MWTISQILSATGGRLLQGDPDKVVGPISTDSRNLQPGACFLALVGDRHDGHAFVGDVSARGCGAVVIAEGRLSALGPIPSAVAVVEVADTLCALGSLAHFRRMGSHIPVIGITGSNGKTSTKEILAGILGVRHKVLKTQGNFNNLIGLPLTLLRLEPEHEMAVVEMGINVPGEMSRLVQIGEPTVGLITNIHPAHLEGLGSLDGILEEKGKLWLGLKSDGLAVVNLDDERLAEFSKRLSSGIMTYSISNRSARVKLAGNVDERDGCSSFRLSFDGVELKVRFPVLGRHQLMNALAAAATAWGLGEPLDVIGEALASHQAVKGRMQVHRLEDGRVLVDDTYNANPGSMLAALQAIKSSCRGMPITAVLGEMRELGPNSASIHADLGRKIAGLGVNRLITIGEKGHQMCLGAQEGGMDPAVCIWAASHDEVIELLKGLNAGGEWILVKGSRAMAMERVVEGIIPA